MDYNNVWNTPYVFHSKVSDVLYFCTQIATAMIKIFVKHAITLMRWKCVKIIKESLLIQRIKIRQPKQQIISDRTSGVYLTTTTFYPYDLTPWSQQERFHVRSANELSNINSNPVVQGFWTCCSLILNN